MEIIYTKGWFRQQKRPLQEFSKEEALKLYNNRQPFSIVIEKDNNPFCFINFNNKFVYVGFLDRQNREYLGYEFWEYQNNKIFLKEIQYWEYEGETDNKMTSKRYRFTPEGEFGIENRNNKTKEVIRKCAENKIDVSALWEIYPEFGKYDDIIKVEREREIEKII